MPTQIESAKFARIKALDVTFVERKVRTVGRLLTYDAVHGLVVLLDADGKHTVIVDVQEALDDSSSQWAGERLGTVIVMGYVEESPEEFPSIDTHPFARGILRPPSSLLIRAILVVAAEDMDLKLWDAVVEAETAQG